ncbi:MAG: class I SAM-dependent methyltransferase, partial [Chlamydiia bacterium]|nr:class I SAM-dependent methyltransferase [Chlamydiia bacterium]
AEVCHVDASQGMVAWARENAALNGLDQHPIRWIVDDVRKFLQREANRGRRYDIILLDPPSFGRGKKGEIFKIERDLPELLELCEAVLEPRAHGIFLSCHTPGYTPVVLENLLRQVLKGRKGRTDSGEMLLSPRDNGFSIPCGAFARWQYA